MMIIGITGSIGSGKSEVARVFAENGAMVIDADQEAKALLKKGEEGYEALIQAFGEGILDERGEIDRQKLAERVFRDRDQVARINRIIHPLVHKRIVEKLRNLKARSAEGMAVIDAPLLIEAGFHTLADHVVLVVPGDPRKALERAASRIGISVEEARRRFSFQMSREEKERVADTVIINDGSLEALHRKAREVWRQMLKKEDSKKE